MGRSRKKDKNEIEDTEPDYDWPFEISIKLNRHRPKVAFLSGTPREYYPEDPGFNKFAQTYALPFPDEFARPNYVPSDNLLDKPISLKGYGIGGLSAPRFAPDAHESNPAPNVYQSELVPPPMKKIEKAKRQKWKDFVKTYEDIVNAQYATFEAKEAESNKHKFLRSPIEGPAADYNKKVHKKPRVQLDTKREQAKLCKKKFAAFGMGFNNSRFQQEEKDDKVGVGTYTVNIPALKRSFQITTPEGKLIPRVRLVCHPSGCDVCMHCFAELYEADYYQTKTKYKIQSKMEPETEGKVKMQHLSLCRECYCTATKDGYPPWTKDKIPGLFMKARHCNSVHDHKEGHDEFLMKSTCKLMLHLSRRELIYSRYFKDNPCEKTR